MALTTSPRLNDASQSARTHAQTMLNAPRVRAGAVIALAIAAGLVTWLIAHGNNHSAKVVPVVSASEQTLLALPAAVGHPVYWVGARAATTYELTRTSDGRIYVRYLPVGVGIGAKTPYLTIGTYPVQDALGAVRKVAKRTGGKVMTLQGGGIAAQDMQHPSSVYAAYPGSNYEIEVYDPSGANARALVSGGKLTALGNAAATNAGGIAARAMTHAQLHSLAKRAGHAVYWIGPSARATYEATQTADGRIYVRYLPAGVAAGSQQAFTTIGTYPVKAAAGAIAAAAKRSGSQTFSIPGGGIAVVSKDHPTSVYAAFPKSGYEIEVFDPSAARARALVESGRLAPIR